MLEIMQITLLEGRDNAHENAARLMRAAVACGGMRGVSVRLTKGRYFVGTQEGDMRFDALMRGAIPPTDYAYWRDNRETVLPFQRVTALELDGAGAELVFTGLVQPVALDGCADVHIHHLCIDWDRPPFSVGRAVAVEGSRIVMEMEPGYSIRGGEPVVSFQNFRMDDRVPLGTSAFEGISAVQLLSSGLAAIETDLAGEVSPGDGIILRHIYSYACGIHLLRSREVCLRDITLHACPGMGVIGHDSEHIEIAGMRVAPSGGRPMSVNCDATHFISCTGNLHIHDCHFEGMGDDALNAHGFYQLIERVTDSHTMECVMGASPQDNCPDFPDTGDAVTFTRRDTLLPYAGNWVTGVMPRGDGRCTVTLKQPLPEGFRPDDVLYSRTKSPHIRFENNRVEKIRGRGILIQASGAQVRGCHFEHCTGEGVHVVTAAGWWESGATENTLVEDCTFRHCGYGTTKYCDAVAVMVDTECDRPEIGVHRNIILRGNTAIGDKPAFYVTCASNVIIENNTTQGCPVSVQAAYCANLYARLGEADAPPLLLEGNQTHTMHMVRE